METVQLANNVSSANYNPPIITISEDMPLEKRMGLIYAKAMQEICTDNENRRLGWQDNHDLLKEGAWYANDYFKALKQIGSSAEPRLNYMIKNGIFTILYHQKKNLN